MGYAGLTAPDLVARCELLTTANLRRTVGARRDTPALELVQIAEACAVPWSWFESGHWETTQANGSDDVAAASGYLRFGEGSVDERVLMLETYMGVVLRALTVLGSDVAPLPAPAARPRTRAKRTHADPDR
jgi:hypothetical protein